MQRVRDRMERGTLGDGSSCIDYNKIKFLEDQKANKDQPRMQSIVLLAAYIAGTNKESSDVRLFDVERSKWRGGRGHQAGGQVAPTSKTQGALLVGKTKRFTIDRLVAIAQFLASMMLEGCDEHLLVNQSADFYACANTLVTEGLLKKASMRVGVQT